MHSHSSSMEGVSVDKSFKAKYVISKEGKGFKTISMLYRHKYVCVYVCIYVCIYVYYQFSILLFPLRTWFLNVAFSRHELLGGFL